MSKSWRPENIDQLLEAVSWAVAKGESFNIRGRGSKQNFGRPIFASHNLDLSGLKGITTYEPRELFMTADVATFELILLGWGRFSYHYRLTSRTVSDQLGIELES